MILFLDFDGVLHPPNVYNTSGKPELMEPGALFMHAHLLTEALAYHPDARIVLSSSWVRVFGFEIAKSYLPMQLQARVIGCTDQEPRPGGMYGSYKRSRFEAILDYVSEHQVKSWLAVDDLHEGTESWPAQYKAHLILCNAWHGLGDPETLIVLNTSLESLRYVV